ncbi:MAG: adenine phosphoribosyltransferase [Isosphaeraceae bacterium]
MMASRGLLGYNRTGAGVPYLIGFASESGMPPPASLDLRQWIRDIPDFPKPGIRFKDITPLLAHSEAFHAVIDRLAGQYAGTPIDTIAAAEARGFIFGAPLALKLNAGFVPIRKPGKLPYATVAHEYQLEYGSDRLEVHTDAFAPGRRILLLDDVLATGGTMQACCDLVKQVGAEVVACAFVLELTSLGGRDRLAPYKVTSLLSY